MSDRCHAREDDGGEVDHCTHTSGADLVCCWCGDVFEATSQASEHGENVPPDETARLRTRVDELLAAMVRLTREAPYEEERGNIATLIAEVGTLRASNAANLAEIQRLDGELAKARALLADAVVDRDSMRALLDQGHEILVSMIGAFASVGIAANNGRTAAEDIRALGAERDTARAEVSRLKAGLREMRESVATGPNWGIARESLVNAVDALIG